jgi:hypothetical protein
MNCKIEILPQQYKNGHLDGIIMLSFYDADVIGSPLRRHFAFAISKNSSHFSGIDGDTLPPEMWVSRDYDSELYERIAVAVNAMYAGWRQESMVMWHHTDEIGATA